MHKFQFLRLFIMLACLPICSIQATKPHIEQSDEKITYQKLMDVYAEAFQEELNEIENPVHSSFQQNAEQEKAELEKDYIFEKNVINLSMLLNPTNKILDYTLKLYNTYGPRKSFQEDAPYDEVGHFVYFGVPSLIDKFNPKAANILRQILITADQDFQDIISEEEENKQMRTYLSDFIKESAFVPSNISQAVSVLPQDQDVYQELVSPLKKEFQEQIQNFNENQEYFQTIDYQNQYDRRKNIVNLCKKLDTPNTLFYDYALNLLEKHGPDSQKQEQAYTDIYQLIIFGAVPNIVEKFNPTFADALQNLVIEANQYQHGLSDRSTFYTFCDNFQNTFLKL